MPRDTEAASVKRVTGSAGMVETSQTSVCAVDAKLEPEVGGSGKGES